ncbi:MAG TPA: DUF5615 family PIN-like protein [Thermomicrobiaceae bacterium]|nr:DUF5615 family PIN-like protein [Thermomicrobiaceae bacterium]
MTPAPHSTLPSTRRRLARLHVDADVAPPFITLLRAHHDIVTASERGLRTATDAEQLIAATDESRILVTHNGKDYVLLFHAWRGLAMRWGVLPVPEHAGVISVPQVSLMPFTDSLRHINALIDGTTPWNEVYVWSAKKQSWDRYR